MAAFLAWLTAMPVVKSALHPLQKKKRLDNEAFDPPLKSLIYKLITKKSKKSLKNR